MWAAGCSMRVSGVGRVVEIQLDVWCSWTIAAGSWGRLSQRVQLDDHCGKLVSVVAGKSISLFWQYVGLTGGVSFWLLARIASRAWTGCCNARAVRNSESYVDRMLHCWSVVVEVGVGSLVASSRASWWLRLSDVLVLRTKGTGGETVAKVHQALAHTRSSERVGEARASLCP